MLAKLGSDEQEAKKCNRHSYGKKFKSYRKGYIAGKHDARRKDLPEGTAKNPYNLSEEVWELLKKRARWEMGYDAGWEVIHRRRLKKKFGKTKKQMSTKKKKKMSK